MARFRRSSFRGSSKPLHPTRWCALSDYGEVVPAGNSNIINICSAAKLEEFTNPTIVRIRGDLTVNISKTDPLASQAFAIALGIRTVEESFLLANLQSLLTDDGAEAPWMWFGYAVLATGFQSYPVWNTVTSAVQFSQVALHIPGMTAQTFSIDVKAMRRVPQNTKLILAYSTRLIGGTPDLGLHFALRTLVKE